MKLLYANIKHDKLGNEGTPASGGQGAPSEVDPPAPEKTPASPAAPEAAGNSGEADDGFDEFGYAKDEGDKDKKAAPAAKSEQTPEDTEEDPEIKGSATGYGDDIEEPAAAKKPAAPAAPEKPASTKEALGFELNFAELDKDTATEITDFAKANGLTKEAAQALVDRENLITKELAAAKIAREENIKAQTSKLKSDWQKELKEDPKFGRENYKKSVFQADKVLQNHFPELQKHLTDGKGMLPPMVMKELRNLHDVLYKKPEKIQQGDPPAPPEPEADPNDHLNFYK